MKEHRRDGRPLAKKRVQWLIEQSTSYYLLVSVCLSTYFLIKRVFLALRQKDETDLHRKGETEIHRGL